jgi:aldose 1-epimerase
MRESFEGTYQGERAIWLRNERFEAAMVPELGGNMLVLRDRQKNVPILHEPKEGDIAFFKQKPFWFGIPVCFPPNRYEDGKFPWQGKTYQLPTNETARNNHLHGFLHNCAWDVIDFGITEHDSYVQIRVVVDETHRMYSYLPFPFTFDLTYRLHDAGLSQFTAIRNDGEQVMPCLLAYHTALVAPENSTLKLAHGPRYAMNERMLPTGVTLPLSAFDVAMAEAGVSTFAEEMDNHYDAIFTNGVSTAELIIPDTKTKVTYTSDPEFKKWMVWNNFAKPGFVCPEPQVNLVNAPNAPNPESERTMRSLQPGEQFRTTCNITIEDL